jgi:hypothetical protein
MSTTRTSCVNISNVLRIMYVDETMFFAKISLITTRFLIFFIFVIIFTFSFNKWRIVSTSFFVFQFFVNVSSNFCRQHSQILFFLLFSDLEYYCFFSFNFLQLTLLINVIICRFDDNRKFDVLHVFCFCHDNINKQNKDDFRSISFKIFQSDVHFSQRQEDLILYDERRQQDVYTLK